MNWIDQGLERHQRWRGQRVSPFEQMLVRRLLKDFLGQDGIVISKSRVTSAFQVAETIFRERFQKTPLPRIVEDPDVPDGEIHLVQPGRIDKIVNIGPEVAGAPIKPAYESEEWKRRNEP